MNLNMHTGLGARFKLQVRKSGTFEVTKESAWSDNIVLDSGLARMSVGTWIDRCCVGTGNSTPVASQVAIDSFLASTTSTPGKGISLQTTTAPYYSKITQKWSFGIGVAAGNISEVGLGWGNANLWDRALIKDAAGNPTTITVLSDEHLDVISEIRFYPKPMVDGVFNLLDKVGAIKSTHSYIGRTFLNRTAEGNYSRLEFNYVSIYSNAIDDSPINSPSGQQFDQIPPTTYPTPTSAQAVIRIGSGGGNFAHKSFALAFQGFGIDKHSLYKMQIDPPITKTNMQEMTYTVTVSWGRYEPT